jgi:hypothetical protein
LGRLPLNDVRDEYAHWMATPQRLKVSLNLPQNHSAFAEYKGVNRRTLARWREEPEFQQLIEQKKLMVRGQLDGAAVSARGVGKPRPIQDPRPLKRLEEQAGAGRVTLADDPVMVGAESLSDEELAYMRVKDTLVRMAEDGEKGAIDLYLKHYGQVFIDAEADELEDFTGLSDDDLVNELLSFVGVERVARWLAEHAALEVADGY